MDIRELREGDEPAVLRLLAAAMGWSGDADDAAYFHWKHGDNPFGRSPGWVAVEAGEVVGLRVFLRWELTDGAATYRVVRAVDTATHPDHQGKGVFRALTEHALSCLEAEGVDFVFNTPNDQSKPGYLKMGWEELGRLPVAIKVRSPLGLARMARSRVAADRQPVPTSVGAPASVALEGAERLPGIDASAEPGAAPESGALPAPPQVPETGVEPVGAPDTEPGAEVGASPGAYPGPGDTGELATPRSPAFLRWRYGLESLGYRGWEPPAGGLVLFRLRRRGRATELVVGDLLLPPHAERTRTVGKLLKSTGADYALRIAVPGSVEAQLAPPGLGPVLTWRGLARTEAPPLDRWRLAMGDIELF